MPKKKQSTKNCERCKNPTELRGFRFTLKQTREVKRHIVPYCASCGYYFVKKRRFGKNQQGPMLRAMLMEDHPPGYWGGYSIDSRSITHIAPE
ncbi:MAG: hypothetical protein ABIG28_02575 [archaeon]